ncbi:MAG: molybdopterin converting factor small subunit [Candidatus Azotimanducaceae bacterium]|jgi:molybdopterin converting factor small subunit
MAKVMFSSELQKFTGEVSTSVHAADYRSLITALCDQYVDLDRVMLTAMAVAIDGVIIVDPLLEPIGADSEIHFLHFVAGG